jgi:hypothetical protein
MYVTGKNSVVLLLVLIEARTLDGGPGQWPASEINARKGRFSRS